MSYIKVLVSSSEKQLNINKSMSISFARPTADVSCILDSKLYVKKSAFYLIYEQKKLSFRQTP